MRTNRKTNLLLILVLLISMNLQAQSLADGIRMYNYKKIKSARKILEPLASTDARANYYLGLTYLDEGNVTNASSIFQKFPEDPANIAGTARVAFSQKDPTKAMQILKDLVAKAKKKDVDPLRFAADAIIYSQGGDYYQAIAWDSAVYKKGVKDGQLFIALGDALMKMPGGGGEAMNNFENVRDNYPEKSLGYSRIGDTWLGPRNDLALENYTKAKETDSTNPLPYHALAQAYQYSGNYKLAVQNIRRYMELSDNSFEDKKLNVELLYQSKNYCEAVTLVTDLMKTQPIADSILTEFYGILGFSQAQCGDSIMAIQNIRTYFNREKPDRKRNAAYIDFGRLWIKIGNLDSAGYYYTLGLSGDTSREKANIYREVAEGFKTKKDYCKSADWYEILVKANPDAQPIDYYWRGNMYYYCSNYTKSIICFEEMEKRYPEQPSAVYWQGKNATMIDTESKMGNGEKPFLRFIDKYSATAKPAELKTAYTYLVAYYFNSENKEQLPIYKEKLRAIDPNNATLKQIEEIEANKNKPRPTPKPAAKNNKK